MFLSRKVLVGDRLCDDVVLTVVGKERNFGSLLPGLRYGPVGEVVEIHQ